MSLVFISKLARRLDYWGKWQRQIDIDEVPARLAAIRIGPSYGVRKNLDQIDDEIRARLAYVPQSPSLFPWMTVEQHLRVIGQAYPNWTEAPSKTRTSARAFAR